MSRSTLGKLKLQAEKLEKKMQKYERRIQRLSQEAYHIRQAQEINLKLMVTQQEKHNNALHRPTSPSEIING